jgi:hypothetical protein
MHKAELRNLYASPHTIRVVKPRRMRLEGHITRTGVMRNAYKIFVRKSKKRTLGKHGRRREDNIRMDLRETGWEIVDWMHLAHDRDH